MLLGNWLLWDGQGWEEGFACEITHLNHVPEASAWGKPNWYIPGYPEPLRVERKGGKRCRN